jgi:hypothetical protein
MREPLSESALRAAENFLNEHPDQVEGMRAAAAKAIRALTDTTGRHFDSACETFAEWLWILESETGDTANEFGDDSVADSDAASRLGDDAAMHGFAIVGAWLKSFPSTWDATGWKEMNSRSAMGISCVGFSWNTNSP